MANYYYYNFINKKLCKIPLSNLHFSAHFFIYRVVFVLYMCKNIHIYNLYVIVYIVTDGYL